MGLADSLKSLLLGIKNSTPKESIRPLAGHELVVVYSPDNEVDLAFVKGLLEGEGIPYFVHNDHFGSLRVGPMIPLFNQKAMMVEERYGERAASVIKDYLENVKHETESPGVSHCSLIDRIRVVMEAVICGWFVPGRACNRDEQDPSRSLPKDDWLPILTNTLAVILFFLAFFMLLDFVRDLISGHLRHH